MKDDVVELELLDRAGIVWRVGPFFVFYRSDKLLCHETIRLTEVYGVVL